MSESELPPAIALLWGVRDAPRRGGPRPALSIERIVAAAVELADTAGLAGLSMSRLAESLGFTTMSLYRYVASKDDLLVLLVDAALGLPPEDTSGTWRERCARWARAEWKVYQQHPWALGLPISGMPAGPNQLTWFDRGLAALGGTTLTEPEKASTMLLLTTYVRGQAQLVVDLTRAAQSGGPDWAQLVRRLADPERFPAVAAVVAANTFDDDPAGFPDDEFDFGLQRVLDGIEALHRARVGG